MSVFKRGGKGPYYIQFTYKGKVYLKSSRTQNKVKAARMERDWKEQVHAEEELGIRPDISVHEALDACVRSKRQDGTRQYYRQNASVIKGLFRADQKIGDLKDWDLVKFKEERLDDGKSPQTVKHNLNVLKGAVTWAEDNGYRVSNLRFPSVKVEKGRLRYLSTEEEERLLAELDPQRDMKYRPRAEQRSEEEMRVLQDNHDLVILLLDTGARYSEIANIKWTSIDLSASQIRLWRPKVRNESILFMSRRVKKVLERRSMARAGEYVFCNKSGGPRGYQSKGIRAAIKRAGLDGVRIHDLRHTCASRLVQNGMSLYEVSQILGHTSVQTTQRYAHLEMRDVGQKARDILDSL